MDSPNRSRETEGGKDQGGRDPAQGPWKERDTFGIWTTVCRFPAKLYACTPDWGESLIPTVFSRASFWLVKL